MKFRKRNAEENFRKIYTKLSQENDEVKELRSQCLVEHEDVENLKENSWKIFTAEKLEAESFKELESIARRLKGSITDFEILIRKTAEQETRSLEKLEELNSNSRISKNEIQDTRLSKYRNEMALLEAESACLITKNKNLANKKMSINLVSSEFY